ncbi:MAG: MATE family efflux transporter [Lachnospiraceae bacterium]|nr:MATE family efflux transporter [Lachnospiraceae bacterium]
MLYSKKDLQKLIIPLVFEQLLSLLVGLADTLMISGVGEAAVSGVSLVDTLNILIINIFMAFGTGGAVVAGHYLGQKDSENAGRAAWQVNLFSAVSAVAVTILFMVFHDGLLHLVFGQVEVAVMENAKSYLLITAVSILPLAIYNACAGLFRAMGDSKTTLYISILMNVLNVAGNAILIYGAQMGTAGAATATTISRTVAAVLIFALMFQRKRVINFCGKVTLRFEPHMIKKILHIGVPNSLENSLFQLGKIITISMVSTYGTYAIAANAVCNTLTAFNMLPALAINSAILSIVSVCIGAGENEQARYYTKKLMKLANVSLIIMSALIILGADVLLAFYNLSPEATVLAKQVLCYHAVLAVLFWIPSFSLPNAFRAAGDVLWPMAIAILSMWVFRLALSYFLGTICSIGLMGVWIAMTVDWAFRAVCYMIRFRGNKWEKMKV